MYLDPNGKTVTAVQWNGSNLAEISMACFGMLWWQDGFVDLKINSYFDGEVAEPGDWITFGEDKKFRVIKRDDFKNDYRKA